MNIRVVVREAEEGGYWAEVPALPGCATQGETLEDLMANVREAVEGWLGAEPARPAKGERILDLVV
ncbi:MAG TPA: type II toxin-antitoxin system HicB family antitoxin [Caulobacteraceae bacterium]